MASRWNVLALLFTVRLSMAFQFQSVASLAPPIMKAYGVALSDVGLLISLYLAPGLLFALPGGEIGRRFGDKRIVVFALFLMILGGLTMTWAGSWHWLVAGRVLSGIGGVLLNVLISKMVTDWFAGREIATAMAIIVNAWPAGIALSLLATPALVVAYGLKAAFLVATGFCAVGLILLSTLYRGVPQSDAPSTSVSASWPRALATKAVLLAGCIWGLYNAAMGMIFGFGPVLLAERGWSLAASGSATSLVLWIIAASVPIWGLLADRTGRRVSIMLVGFALFALTLAVAARADMVILSFAAVGLVAGMSAGPIMSLPARVLEPSERAVGMGLYFTMFYAFTVAAPILAGIISSQWGTARGAFDFGVIMLIICFPAYWLFTRVTSVPTGRRKSDPSQVQA